MQYKLPERYRGCEGFLQKTDNIYKPKTLIQKISSVEKISTKYEKYDIETETHNFFANKILVHNSNSRYLWDGQRMHIGSRNRWLEEEGDSAWHKVLTRRPEIRDLCMANPNCVLWGEVFGWVQDLHYGMDKGVVDFTAFDIMLSNGKFADVNDMLFCCKQYCVPTAPTLGIFSYDFDYLMKLAEGPTWYGNKPVDLAPHYREGVVVRPLNERWDNHIGRAQLKIVSMTYLENAGKEKKWEPK
jgi:hypothetical protein